MKHRRWHITLFIGALSTMSMEASDAYQFRTHGAITEEAFRVSRGVNDYLQSLGINSRDRFARSMRTEPPFLAFFDNNGTPSDWMIEGVIREDDYTHRPLLTPLGCAPPSNPPSQINRPLNHFLDVQRGGGGMHIPFIVSGYPANDWALGKQGRSSAGNEYSLPDARHYQFLSLMGPSIDERHRDTALLFRALGHVIHLLQDVAQPQHTRQDPHSGCVEPIGGHSSWYEKYIETRALTQTFRTRGSISSALRLDGYPPPNLTTYEAYWTGFKGLADFSSRNFFSVGTNLDVELGCFGLPAPPCRPDAYEVLNQIVDVFPVGGGIRAGRVRVFWHRMVDPVTGGLVSAQVTSRSLWDQHLERENLFPIFALNTVNYDSAADILIPRAVGYSAGLLDRFFRASVSASIETDQRVIFHNGSSDETLNGVFYFLHESPDGVRQSVASIGLSIPPQGESEPVAVRMLPRNPPPGTRCWVVFRGTLGDEKDVVAGSLAGCPVEVPPPSNEGSEWAVYTCLFIPVFDNRPASPDEYVYYRYATQGWIVDQDGNPAFAMTPNWRTQCWLSSRGFLPDGQTPTDARLDFIPADFVPPG
jgi:hypothetical protein